MSNPFKLSRVASGTVSAPASTGSHSATFDPVGATTSGLSFAAGGAVVGSAIGGPVGGVTGAVLGGASGLYLGGFKNDR